MLDGDTQMAPGSLTAALRAVGGACAAVDAVLDGQDDAAFVAMRPPGHHAERETAMGFCLLARRPSRRCARWIITGLTAWR